MLLRGFQKHQTLPNRITMLQGLAECLRNAYRMLLGITFKAKAKYNENPFIIIDLHGCFPWFSALMRRVLAKVHPHGLVRPLNQFKNAASKMVFGGMLAECLRDACEISGKPPAQPSHFFYTDS